MNESDEVEKAMREALIQSLLDKGALKRTERGELVHVKSYSPTKPALGYPRPLPVNGAGDGHGQRGYNMLASAPAATDQGGFNCNEPCVPAYRTQVHDRPQGAFDSRPVYFTNQASLQSQENDHYSYQYQQTAWPDSQGSHGYSGGGFRPFYQQNYHDVRPTIYNARHLFRRTYNDKGIPISNGASNESGGPRQAQTKPYDRHAVPYQRPGTSNNVTIVAGGYKGKERAMRFQDSYGSGGDGDVYSRPSSSNSTDEEMRFKPFDDQTSTGSQPRYRSPFSPEQEDRLPARFQRIGKSEDEQSDEDEFPPFRSSPAL